MISSPTARSSASRPFTLSKNSWAMTKDELPLSKGEAKILRELEKLRARATALEERSKELEKVHKTKPGSTLSVQYLRWEADRLYFSNDCLRRHNAQLTRALNQI